MKFREALNLIGWILLPIWGGFLGYLTWLLANHCG